MIGPPPRSPLFPYTTLFQSSPEPRATTISVSETAASAPPMIDDQVTAETPLSSVPMPLSGVLTELGIGTERSEEHTSELQSHLNLVCRLLLEKKKQYDTQCT